MPYKDPIKNKECIAKYHKKFGLNHTRTRRLKHMLIVERIKLELGCVKCGYDVHPKALEFHHLIPKEKSFTISQKLTSNLLRILKETEKCDVLCSNCHKIEESRLNLKSLY